MHLLLQRVAILRGLPENGAQLCRFYIGAVPVDEIRQTFLRLFAGEVHRFSVYENLKVSECLHIDRRLSLASKHRIAWNFNSSCTDSSASGFSR